MLKQVSDYTSLVSETGNFAEPVIIGFFGSFSSRSESARVHFEAFAEKHPEIKAYFVDVARVKDVHGKFGIAEVPTVLVVHEGRVVQQAIGSGSVEVYESTLLATVADHSKNRAGNTRPSHSVTVYSTQVCPWCRRVKNYLRSVGVSYRDIDVGRDQAAAQELVRRSGQTGVPQVEIDGRIVVGFDQPRIDALLGISGQA